MQITGTAHMNAPGPVAWAAFHDPGVLTRTIPGLQSLEETGKDAYKATIKAGVASIKGTYSGNVALTEHVEHESFLLKAAGQGGPGTISADVRVHLAPAADGGTDINWTADASVGGAIGGVGQRMLQGVARKMATQFFAAIDADIANGGAAATEAAPLEAGTADDAAGPAASPAAAPAAGAAAPGPQPARAVHQAPAAAAAASSTTLLGAAVVGALIALVGVLVGILAGRR
ncbi:SRPBCC family protein [Propionibacteriaceae bacterium Y1923]|uniref:SRPBCC family protein n=1 Tax=Aestuariimicrobium sp. Y1814 TaxID=3418742 RepID=UPI003C1879D8